MSMAFRGSVVLHATMVGGRVDATLRDVAALNGHDDFDDDAEPGLARDQREYEYEEREDDGVEAGMDEWESWERERVARRNEW